jgi:hypothetical protein
MGPPISYTLLVVLIPILPLIIEFDVVVPNAEEAGGMACWVLLHGVAYMPEEVVPV